jgi:hypothetical protein
LLDAQAVNPSPVEAIFFRQGTHALGFGTPLFTRAGFSEILTGVLVTASNVTSSSPMLGKDYIFRDRAKKGCELQRAGVEKSHDLYFDI